MTYYAWSCTTCDGRGRVQNDGLPVTSLVNRAAIAHKIDHPECSVASDAEVSLFPGACTFSQRAGTPGQHETTESPTNAGQHETKEGSKQ